MSWSCSRRLHEHQDSPLPTHHCQQHSLGVGFGLFRPFGSLSLTPQGPQGGNFPPTPSKPPQPAQYVLHEFAFGSLGAESHQVVGTHHPPRVLVLAQGTCQAEGTLTGTRHHRRAVGALLSLQPRAPIPSCPSSPCLQKPRSYQGQPTVLAVPPTCRKGQSLVLHSPAGTRDSGDNAHSAGITQGWAG